METGAFASRSTDRIIGFTRDSQQLTAIISRLHNDVTDIEFDDATEEQLCNSYIIEEVPFCQLDKKLKSQYKRLSESWNVLSSIKAWDETTLFNLLIVLLGTTPLYASNSDNLNLPDTPFETPKPKASAAHPRAFAGTTYRPPKGKHLHRLDLRPYICNQKQLQRALEKLFPYWDKALELLSRSGYNIESMKAVTQDNFTELDLYYVFHHCQISSIKRYQLPNEFIKYILPCLKGQSWKTVQSALSAFWNGSAKENTILLCTLSRALSTRIDCTNTLQNILFVPESRRVLWIAMQINTDTLSAPCLPENIELFHSLTTNDYYRDNLYFFLLSLKRGIYPDYFFTALRLINEFDVRDSFARSKVFYKCTIPAYEVIRRIIATISEADDYYKNNVIDLWERCGELDQYVSFLNSRDWSKYSPNTAFELYRLFSSFFDRYELSESQIQEKWYFLRDQADVIESMVQDIEVEYRPRFIMQLGDYFWYWDTIEALEEYIPPAYIFAKRMSKSPFSTTKCSATYLLSDFIDKLSKERLSEFLNIPDTSLITIEDQSKSDNNSRLINYGMFHLIKEIPELVMICVNSYLKKLCKVAKKQGVLTRAQRYPTICNFKNHPLMNADLHKLNTTDLCDRITPYVSDTISNPIPKKLQLFIRGEYTLTEQRIERYRSKIFENLPATQLDILEQITIDVIKSNHDYTSVESNKAEHTMMLMNWIDDNRRAFKRFLHEYSEGNINYLKDHPATEQWKKGHPDLDSSKWEQGLILHYDSKELGPIRLEIEQEPLEALRLGSYVGSCLGVGGICSYSAAAVILDYNKQVLYARNENNKVIARQVVTISEQKSLVCFSVYPVGVDEELQIMFKNYDEQLSTHLGYDLYIDENNDNRVEKNKPKAKDADKDEESDYTISHILSHDWWDDTPWDFTIENKQKES